ncbi:GNAT family N-acetyltransferase [Mameliella alba]|nr:GNAT family N-acetyltransferase [Mameliella alba]MBY6167952.1 GNAT family N-acetyltransferase [Mameliella alba]MBY6172973.1 GNAT family N-acetyltransferase [Mameliella alba]
MTEQASDALRAARRYRSISRALYSALASDPFYATIEARSGTGHLGLLAYFDLSIAEAESFGRAVYAPDAQDGASLWSVPLDHARAKSKSNDKSSMILAALGPEALATYKAICEFMEKAAEPLIDPSDWYLSILGLRAECQGRGLGAQLVRPVLADADASGAATFLETFTPRNMGFYERLGYRTVGQFREPVTDADYWLMRRLPQSTTSAAPG